MNVDRTTIDRLAAETGFAPGAMEKVIRLGDMLADVQRHPLLSRVLVLKGGTALNLCFGAPPRLSVDLDFNYVGAEEREAMLAQRPDVERAVEMLAAAQRYSVQRSADSHAGRKLYLGYLNAAGGADRLEVDLNFLHRLPLLDCQRRPIWQPPGRPFLEAVVHAPVELVAGKLCALFSRRLPRDLFDAVRIPDILGEDWLQTPARPLFVALAGTLDRPYYEHAVQRLRDGSLGDVEAELRPLLRLGQPLGVEDLRVRAWAVIEPLIRPTDAEREYTDRLQAGELLPELLFPDDEQVADRLRRHPALLWKAQHAAAHAQGRSRARRKSE
jgi:predicted nucleotidyltransferase component of viral defense system